MPFQPGNKLAPGNGRPRGSLNKRSIEFLAILEKHKFCPAEALIECYREAKKTYDNYATIYEAITDARIVQNDKDGSCATPTEDKAHVYLKIAAEAAKDLAAFAFPKLKAVESSQVKATDNMSPKEKLEAARMIVKMLEQEVKDVEATPSGQPGSGAS